MRRVLRSIAGIDATAADTLLAAAGIDPEARPETLSPEAFARLVAAVDERP
jgi:16S rRNA (adenine1518-N6/adenine1519-N6)-dimethyltransferase